jgi:GNAT superfamily N-acetyltransferase
VQFILLVGDVYRMLETTYPIKQATADHIEKITDFVKQMLKKLYSEGQYNPDPVDLARFIDVYIAPANACFYVAENRYGQIIGTAAVRRYDDRFPYLRELLTEEPVCEMARFYIDDGYRRKGIGGELYAQAEAFASQAGYKQCYLHTSLYLPGGFPFWTSRGYEELHWETDQIVHMGKVFVT